MLYHNLKRISKRIQKYRTTKKQFVGDTGHRQTLAHLAYVPLSKERENADISKVSTQMGYFLDPDFSTDETKVFVNPDDKRAVVSYRGTYNKDKKSRAKDIASDIAVALGMEQYDKRFRDSDKHFKKIKQKYPDYKLDVTGHSLGGQISKYVTDRNYNDVDTNYAFSRGSGFLEPFRKKGAKTIDVSNENDLISLGARLQGGNQIIEKKPKNPLDAHRLDRLYH